MNRKTAIFKIVAAAALAGGALLSAGVAHAQSTTTFGQYIQNDSTNQNFSYDETTHILSLNAPLSIFFRYSVTNGYGARNTFIAATIQRFSATIGADTNNALTDVTANATNVSFLITADTPRNGFNRLLELDSTSTGALTISGGSGSIAGSTAGGDIVGYSSDFVSFTNTTQRNYSFSFSSIDPAVGSSPAYSATDTNTLHNFTASSTGTFATNPPPVANFVDPEPGSIALMLFAAVPSAGLVYRARRKAR